MARKRGIYPTSYIATKLISYYPYFFPGKKRSRAKVDDGLLDLLKEMEERSEERETAWEEKRLKFELEMEERRRKREQEQDDRMQTMFSAFLQQMFTMMHPPPSPSSFQTPAYPPIHSPTPRRQQHFTSRPIPPQPPYHLPQRPSFVQGKQIEN